MNAAIYARQSLDREGTGAAVSRQLLECRNLANTHDLDVVGEYVDNDVSATRGKRPQFARLLAEIQSGRIRTVVVWHTDRLYRRLRDLVEIVEVAEQHQLRILTVRAGDLDLTNPAGRMIAGMLGHAARYEIEQKGVRQVAAYQQSAREGKWTFSRDPYGYRKDQGQPVIVAEEAAVIREAYRRYIGGDTYRNIAKDFNNRGIPTKRRARWTQTGLVSCLGNPAYAGLRRYKGEVWSKGQWEPIISARTWQRYLTAAKERGFRRDWGTAPASLLAGIGECGPCGGKLSSYTIHQATRQPIPYAQRPTKLVYQCRLNGCVSRLREPIDELVSNAVLARFSADDAVQALGGHRSIAALRSEAREYQRRWDNLAELVADGTIRPQAARHQKDVLAARLSHVQALLGSHAQASAAMQLAMSDDAASTWRAFTLEEKRAVLAHFKVRLNKQGRARPFDPDSVAIQWRANSSPE